MFITLLLGVDGGCARDGTAVGNPGPTKPPGIEDGQLRVVAQTPPEGIALSRAELAVTDLVLLACSEDDDITEVSAILDLLDGEDLTLSAGSWCGLQLSLEDDALVFEGLTGGGVDFVAILNPQAISDGSSFTIDGQTITLTLPTDFLDAAAIESAATKEDTAEISSGDDLAEQWTDAFDDAIAPGSIASDDETESVGSGSADLAAKEDCGCVSTGGGGWWLMAALVALSRRRRSILR